MTISVIPSLLPYTPDASINAEMNETIQDNHILDTGAKKMKKCSKDLRSIKDKHLFHPSFFEIKQYFTSVIILTYTPCFINTGNF